MSTRRRGPGKPRDDIEIEGAFSSSTPQRKEKKSKASLQLSNGSATTGGLVAPPPPPTGVSSSSKGTTGERKKKSSSSSSSRRSKADPSSSSNKKPSALTASSPVLPPPEESAPPPEGGGRIAPRTQKASSSSLSDWSTSCYDCSLDFKNFILEVILCHPCNVALQISSMLPEGGGSHSSRNGGGDEGDDEFEMQTPLGKAKEPTTVARDSSSSSMLQDPLLSTPSTSSAAVAPGTGNSDAQSGVFRRETENDPRGDIDMVPCFGNIIFNVLLCGVGGTLCSSLFLRKAVREKFSIHEDTVKELAIACLCPLCSLGQTDRELRKRNMAPHSAWSKAPSVQKLLSSIEPPPAMPKRAGEDGSPTASPRPEDISRGPSASPTSTRKRDQLQFNVV